MISPRHSTGRWLGLTLSISLWTGCAPDAAEDLALGMSQQALASPPRLDLLDAKYWGGQVDENGNPIDDGWVAAGRNHVMDVTALGQRTYVSAIPANLSVISVCLWRVPTDGGIEQQACVDHDFYNPRRISLTRIDDKRFVIATYNDTDGEGGPGKLHLTSWVASSDDKSFMQMDTHDEAVVLDADVQSMNLDRGILQSNGGNWVAVDFVVGVLSATTGKLRFLNYLLEASGTIRRRSLTPTSTPTVAFNAGTLHVARAPGSARTIVSAMYAAAGTSEAAAGTPRVLYSWDVSDGGTMERKKQTLSSGDAFSQLAGYGSRKVATLEQNPVTWNGPLRRDGATTVRTYDVDAQNNILPLKSRKTTTRTSDSESIYSSNLAPGGDGRLYVTYGTSRDGRTLMALNPTDLTVLASTGMEHRSFGDGFSVLAVLWESDPVVVWQTNHPENTEPAYHLASEAYRLQ